MPPTRRSAMSRSPQWRCAVAISALLLHGRAQSSAQGASSTEPTTVNNSFAPAQSISSRFVQLYNDGQNAPALTIARSALPHEINATLRARSLQWGELGGTLQRLLLWDAGFVLSDQTELTRVYVECGLTMDEIVLSSAQYLALDCPVRQCDSTLMSAGWCLNSSLSDVSKCAASGLLLGADSVLSWSEEEPNIDIPRPTISRVSNEAYSIHMDEFAPAETCEHCPSKRRIATPCTTYDKDAKWCVAKSTGVLTPLLEAMRSANLRGSGSDTSVVLPLLWLSAILVVAVAGLACLLSYRRVQAMKRKMDGVVNAKQLVDPTSITVTSEGELDFVYVHSKESGLAAPVEKGFKVRGTLLADNGSNASSSYTDLINASEVLIAFQSDPIVVQKRIPMMDIKFSRRLCNGANGEVFLGRVHGQRVAIKQLLQLKKNDLDDLECFAREIRLTASLNHPNIIQMVGVAWNTFHNMALVLEYRSGGDLLNAIRKRGARWTWNGEKLRVAIGVAKAMVFLHGRAHPLVHRDIKSRNVLIDAATVEPALCDFGSSRNVSTLDLLSTDPAGTILWSAPEVICSQDYSVKADIFSFGVVLAELDTCSLPYTEERDSDGRPIQAIRIAHMVVENQIKPQLSELCPRFIRELVMKCVKHKPERRPTAEDVLARLTEAALDCAALWKSSCVSE